MIRSLSDFRLALFEAGAVERDGSAFQDWCLRNLWLSGLRAARLADEKCPADCADPIKWRRDTWHWQLRAEDRAEYFFERLPGRAPGWAVQVSFGGVFIVRVGGDEFVPAFREVEAA